MPGDGTAVTTVPVEQLQNARRIAELTHARQRALVGHRIDHPDAPLRSDGVRRPLHEARLGRNPAEREADLIDEANAAHTADATRPKPHSAGVIRTRVRCRQCARAPTSALTVDSMITTYISGRLDDREGLLPTVCQRIRVLYDTARSWGEEGRADWREVWHNTRGEQWLSGLRYVEAQRVEWEREIAAG